MSSTLVYRAEAPTTAQRNRDQVARMLAAARVAKEREAKEARVAKLAERIDRNLTAEAPDAVSVGAKVITGWAKYRTRFQRHAAPHIIAWHIVVEGDEVEYWPLPPQ